MKKKATILTYGCQMNVNESMKIKKILEDMDYEVIDDIKQSDAVFLNTCTVREGAATQIYGKFGELKALKEKNKEMIIAVTGCFAQEMGDQLAKKFREIDIVIGNQNIGKIPEMIEKVIHGEVKYVVSTDNESELPARVDADFDSKFMASLPVMYGCNNFCAYCIVPYVRGRERSVPMEQILDEVKVFIEKGYKEILLLGQNVNSYGSDIKDVDYNFATLLKEISKIDGEFLIRFISPHPRDFTDDLIDVIASDSRFERTIHLPLQAGSTRVLKEMNRGYTKEEYLALAEKIKTKIPDVVLTTDIIVGFPGETEEEFLETIEVAEKVRYANAYTFMYSIRTGTKAATMGEQIDKETKKRRLHQLIEVTKGISGEISNVFLGKTFKVLVEGVSKNNDEMMTGRTTHNKVVVFKGDKSLEGQFVNIKINDAKTWTLYGELQN